MTFRIGSKVRISPDNDNECYAEYKGRKLTVIHVAHNRDEHLGYDEGVGGPLYDLEVTATGASVPFSLYEYEVEGW